MGFVHADWSNVTIMDSDWPTSDPRSEVVLEPKHTNTKFLSALPQTLILPQTEFKTFEQLCKKLDMPTARSEIKKQQQQIVSPFLMFFIEEGRNKEHNTISIILISTYKNIFGFFNFWYSTSADEDVHFFIINEGFLSIVQWLYIQKSHWPEYV